MRTITLLGVVLAVTGCKASNDTASAGEALDSTKTASVEAALVVPALEPVGTDATPEEAAEAASSHAETFFQPAGCVTATANRTVLTYEFEGCTGPYGLVEVNGTLVVTYKPGAGGIEYEARSEGLRVNDAVLDIHKSGVYTRDGDDRRVDVTTESSGVGPRGTHLSRNGTYTFQWNEADDCIALDGEWMTTVGAIRWTTRVNGYAQCDNECPAAGGSIEWESERASLTVTTDGSNVASWSYDGRRDRSGTVELLCGE